MTRYNALFATKFSGCPLLAYGYDPHRGRDVRVFAVPGDHTIVGIDDGTDSWIAPVAGVHFVNAAKLMQDFVAGTLKAPIAPEPRRPRRHTLLSVIDAKVAALVAQAPPPSPALRPRRRLL